MVYVHPSFQRQGIALLAEHGVDSFVLDCGYRTSQRFWRRLIGEDEACEIWHLGTDWARSRLVSPSN